MKREEGEEGASCRNSARLPRSSTNSPGYTITLGNGIDRWIEGGRSRSSSLSSPFRNSSSVFLLRSKSGHGGACDRSQKSPRDTRERERERERAKGSTRATFSRCWPYKVSSLGAARSSIRNPLSSRPLFPDGFSRAFRRRDRIRGPKLDSETGTSLGRRLVRVAEHRGEEFLR